MSSHPRERANSFSFESFFSPISGSLVVISAGAGLAGATAVPRARLQLAPPSSRTCLCISSVGVGGRSAPRPTLSPNPHPTLVGWPWCSHDVTLHCEK